MQFIGVIFIFVSFFVFFISLVIAGLSWGKARSLKGRRACTISDIQGCQDGERLSIQGSVLGEETAPFSGTSCAWYRSEIHDVFSEYERDSDGDRVRRENSYLRARKEAPYLTLQDTAGAQENFQTSAIEKVEDLEAAVNEKRHDPPAQDNSPSISIGGFSMNLGQFAGKTYEHTMYTEHTLPRKKEVVLLGKMKNGTFDPEAILGHTDLAGASDKANAKVKKSLMFTGGAIVLGLVGIALQFI